MGERALPSSDMSTAERPDDAASSPETGLKHDAGVELEAHALARIGVQIDSLGDGFRFRLPVAPQLLDADGHVSFGVLGVFLDLAASQPPEMFERGHFVHADIAIHRLNPPVGDQMLAVAQATRMGRRSGVIEVELVDELGTHIARSIQEVVFPSGMPQPTPQLREEGREAFFSRLTGTCTLETSLEDLVQVARGDGPGDPHWTIPLLPGNRNGYGGLHGGVATVLVDVAASGAVAEVAGRPARTVSAAVRYLVPSRVGPMVARPTVLRVDEATGTAVVVVRVEDAEGRTTIVADAHVALRPA